MAIWSLLGFAGGAVALVAMLSIAGSHGLLPWRLAPTSDHMGREFVAFFAGIAMGCLALCAIYLKAAASTRPNVAP